jgi:uncharacterized protein YjbJ (UPF0337 family)
MDWTVIERMWTQAKGRIQSKWDKLTRDDLELIAGRRERLEAKIRTSMAFPLIMYVRRLMIGFGGRCSSAHAVSDNWVDRGLH